MKRLLCIIGLTMMMMRTGYAARYSDAIVSEAVESVEQERGYVYGNPASNSLYCCLSSEWNESDGFDCSGLVSWAAGLRRHFTVDELLNSFLISIDYEELKPGDFLCTPGSGSTWGKHIMICERNVNGYIEVIHASAGQEKVIRDGGQAKAWTKAKLQAWNFTPYRLKTDAEAPSVSISGVENNHAYFTEKTVSFSASDNLDTRPCGRMWVNGEKILEHRSQGNKTFKETGTYTVKVEAVDWTGNVSAPKEVTFSIVNKANPTVSATNMGGGGEWATERFVVTNWGQRVANGTFMPGISDYPMSNNPSKSLSVSFYSDYAPSVSVQLTHMSGLWHHLPGYVAPVSGEVQMTVSAILENGSVINVGACGESFVMDRDDGKEYPDGIDAKLHKQGTPQLDVEGYLRAQGIDSSGALGLLVTLSGSVVGRNTKCTAAVGGVNFPNFPAREYQVCRGDKPFSRPTSTGHGSLLVADTGNNIIQKFSDEGNFICTIGSGTQRTCICGIYRWRGKDICA